jgi:sulfide:quinone oxidoreductase
VSAQPTRVLIAGGGVAALEAALALRALAEDRVDIELLAPEPHFWYRPLAVAEPFGLGEARRFDLTELAAHAGASVSLGALASIDASKREAYTAAGAAVPYDVLLIASGAVPTPGVHGALTFRGPADTDAVGHLLAETAAGGVRRIAFVVPWGAVWSLPAYELALLTESWLRQNGLSKVGVALVTPEDSPLHLFGRQASDMVSALLEERGIAVHTRAYPSNFRDGQLVLVPGGVVEADRAVALPRLQGVQIGGVPQTRDGFVPVDAHCRVVGLPGVYAAGDVTSFPVKQGGIATQQADAAAEAIAAAAGVDLAPRPFRPVLRGLVLTGAEPRYLRAEIARPGDLSQVSTEPLWWPPAKIAGRHLAPFLARLAGLEAPVEPRTGPGAVRVEVELDPELVVRRERLVEAAVEDALDEAGVRRVGDVTGPIPLSVGPEVTLADLAAKMRDRDVGSALVTEGGRLTGIITSRDLLRAFAGRVDSGRARVREWMTAEPCTVSARTTVGAASFLMTEHNVHHLPVVEGERPVGMIGMRDLVKTARPLAGIGLGF